LENRTYDGEEEHSGLCSIEARVITPRTAIPRVTYAGRFNAGIAAFTSASWTICPKMYQEVPAAILDHPHTAVHSSCQKALKLDCFNCVNVILDGGNSCLDIRYDLVAGEITDIINATTRCKSCNSGESVEEG
jgi:hypothetical protein